MAYDLTNYLVIGVSSRALFDLSHENEIYEKALIYQKQMQRK